MKSTKTANASLKLTDLVALLFVLALGLAFIGCYCLTGLARRYFPVLARHIARHIARLALWGTRRTAHYFPYAIAGIILAVGYICTGIAIGIVWAGRGLAWIASWTPDAIEVTFDTIEGIFVALEQVFCEGCANLGGAASKVRIVPETAAPDPAQSAEPTFRLSGGDREALPTNETAYPLGLLFGGFLSRSLADLRQRHDRPAPAELAMSA